MFPLLQKGSVEITGFKQNGSKISFNFNDANDARINLPIIGYYGYSSKNSLGNVSALKMDRQTGLGQVTLNGKGTVRVDYYQTWIQKSSRIISISSLLIFFLTFYSKKKE
jgi:hypothetical protein